MAAYITVDGEDVDVPEGSTPDQLRQIAAQHRARKDMAGRDPLTRAAIGFAAPFAEVAQGVKQLVKGKDFNSDYIDQIRAAREGGGTAAVVGELGAFALPGGASTKVAGKVISRALPRALAASAGEQGLYEGLRATREGETRAGNLAQGAVWGAAGGGVGEGLARTMGRAIAPFRLSDEAQRLKEFGRTHGIDIPLTVGQAGGRGSVMGQVEEAVSAWPGVGRAVQRAREGAVEAWNLAKLNEAARAASVIPGTGRQINRTGAAGIEDVQRIVKDQYTKALQGRTLALTPNAFDNALGVVQRLPDSDASVALKVLDNVNKDIASGNVSGDAITRLRSEIDDYASKAYREGNYPLGKALDAIGDDVRGLINNSGGWQQNLQLQAADAAYARLADINRAAALKGAVEQGGRFTPSQLTTAIMRGEPASMVASQRVPGLKAAQEAGETLGNAWPSPGPTTAERLLTAGAIGTAGIGADKFLSGDIDPASGLGPAAAYLALGTSAGRRALLAGPNRTAIANATVEALRGPTRAAAARLAAEQARQREENERKRRGY